MGSLSLKEEVSVHLDVNRLTCKDVKRIVLCWQEKEIKFRRFLWFGKEKSSCSLSSMKIYVFVASKCVGKGGAAKKIPGHRLEIESCSARVPKLVCRLWCVD